VQQIKTARVRLSTTLCEGGIVVEPLSINLSLQAIADFILRYAITLAALAALTVGLLEAYKKLFNILARFQQQAVKRWLAQEALTPPAGTQLVSSLKSGGHYGVASNARAKAGFRSKPYDATMAYADMLHLTTGVRSDIASDLAAEGGGPMTRNVSMALFELELAKMMAQIQEAADAALNNPMRYENWFGFLTRGCEEGDVNRWVEAMNSKPPLSDESASASMRHREELAEVYARIRLLMRRQLDSFQTITSYRWKEWNQFWAWLVGGVLLMLAQLIQAAQEGTELTPVSIVTMGVVSLAGGILAPIAKDLVDALAKVKTSV
jgi:hypothetical protein